MDENKENPTPTPDSQPQQQPQPAEPSQEPAPAGELSKDDKMWGTFCHLSALSIYIGIPFGHILGPLIIWLIKKDESPFVNEQGKEILNFQISIMIYIIALAPTLCFPPLFLLLFIGILVTEIVFVIIATITANKGESYRYPCSIRLIK
ncbi:MAG: DUF4870 domain-containing protein [Planctomycetes bacterium]|nr:DUF4870 domain-containing protein [Planctomycetota bacterium]